MVVEGLLPTLHKAGWISRMERRARLAEQRRLYKGFLQQAVALLAGRPRCTVNAWARQRKNS